jgi:hypothetical protein
VLFEAGDPIKAVYFPHAGIISLVVDLASGEMIEAAMVARDTLVDGSAAFDNHISLSRTVVQVAGQPSALDVFMVPRWYASPPSCCHKIARSKVRNRTAAGSLVRSGASGLQEIHAPSRP